MSPRVCLAFILMCSAHAAAGELFLLGAVPQAYCSDVSDDGQVAVGFDTAMVWSWNAVDGVTQVPFGVPPGNGVGGMARITGSGTVIGMNALWPLNDLDKTEATLFTIATGEMVRCGSYGFNCDIERSNVFDMSRDGNTTVGLAWENGCQARAYIWQPGSGIVNLGTNNFFKPSRGNGVDQAGTVVAGWNDDYVGFRQGCFSKLNSTTGLWVRTLLTSTTGSKLGEAQAVSDDGLWVFGNGRTSIDSGAPYRYSTTGGGYVSMGTPVPGTSGMVAATNHDGSMALCVFGGGGGFGAGWLWSLADGWTSLDSIAEANGLDLANDYLGTSLALPLAWTPDMTTIVGTASGSYGTSPFVLHIAPPGGTPCTGDITSDGTVDGADLGILLGTWGSCTDCTSDLDGNGAVDGADLGTLLSSWGACP